MSTFKRVLKVESKLAMRCPDSIFFGVIMPSGIFILIALLCGKRMAFDGSPYTMLQSSFGALITVGICATAFMGIPLTIAEYRDKKILKHFFVTPTTPMLLLGVQLVIEVVLSLVSALLIGAIAGICFGFRILGNPVLFVITYFFVMCSMYSIGMIMASLCKNQKVTNVACTVVYFPMLFLSGATIPYELFPTALKRIADILPLTQGIKLLKNISLGLPTDNILLPILLLSVWIVAGVAISLKAFRWE